MPAEEIARHDEANGQTCGESREQGDARWSLQQSCEDRRRERALAARPKEAEEKEVSVPRNARRVVTVPVVMIGVTTLTDGSADPGVSAWAVRDGMMAWVKDAE